MGVMTSTTSTVQVAEEADLRSSTMPFLPQVWMMTRRSLNVTLRQPAAIIPGTILGVFFLVIFEGSLGGAANFFLAGQSYLGFILPLSIISTALSGSSVAGESIVRDLENGYFDKLLLTPVSRAAMLAGPMIAGALVLVFQSMVVLFVGVIMGLEPATGLPGLAMLLGYALMVGVALSGFIVGVALRTGSSSAVTGFSFMFFPLTFLTAAYTPLELLDGWIRTVADFNPITYILDATRGLLNRGWEPDKLLIGFLVTAAFIAVSFTFSVLSLRARTARR